MPSECLSFSNIPHTTKLFDDFLHDFSRVSAFYGTQQPILRDASVWLAQGAERLEYPAERRAAVGNILERQNKEFGSSPRTFENIQRFRNGASAVLTGQQVGFLGGPLFSIFKALTAVRLAAEATRGGADAVPIFWLATSDHDYEEIKSAVVQGMDGVLHRVELDAALTPGAPMSEARLTEKITPVVERVAAMLGDGEIAQFVRESYVPGEGVGTAFGKLFARLFAEFGVILLDPCDPELARLAMPVYTKAVEEAGEIESALVRRGKELHAAGYHEQVKVVESSTLLFGINNGARTPIHRVNGSFELGRQRLSKQELLRGVEERPEDFSANVLLRPVVQDYLLPTLAYAGGPAEVAYFAQASVVYQHVLGRVTPVVPRFSATLVDARAQRILKQYRLSVAEVLHDPERVRELIAERSLPSDLQAAFENADRVLEEAVAQVRGSLKKLDPTLIEASRHAENKISYQLKRLRTRAANAEVHKNEVVSRHAAHLSSSLFPHKGMQERVITGVSFLARYGLALLDGLYERTGPGCPEHQVICLQ